MRRHLALAALIAFSTQVATADPPRSDEVAVLGLDVPVDAPAIIRGTTAVRAARVARPVDLSRIERLLAITIARVSFNEALDNEPDLELITQVTFGHAETSRGRLQWLRNHSGCVTGSRLTQDEAYARPGNCRWTRNLMPDGRRPRGWLRELHGHWTRTRGRWAAHLTRTIEYVRGNEVADICDVTPDTWDGVRYGRERVGRGDRTILECSVPYLHPRESGEGLRNFAVVRASFRR